MVSVLVAKAFIPNPDNLPIACHIKEDLDENWALYNWVDNLFWGTYQDNTRDMWNKWRANNLYQLSHPNKWILWKDNWNSKKINQYEKDWIFIKEWDSWRDVERELWINSWNISACCRWRLKSAWWFKWEFKI